MKELNELLEIQRESAKDNRAYSIGLFNGIELSVSFLEDRDPKYLSIEKEEVK